MRSWEFKARVNGISDPRDKYKRWLVFFPRLVGDLGRFTHSYLTRKFFLPFSFLPGSPEGQEASNVKCNHCQCHIWSLLDHRIADLHP